MGIYDGYDSGRFNGAPPPASAPLHEHFNYEQGRRDREKTAMPMFGQQRPISEVLTGRRIKVILSIAAGGVIGTALVHTTPMYPIFGVGAAIIAFILLTLLTKRSESTGVGGVRGVVSRLLIPIVLCAIAYDGFYVYAALTSHTTPFSWLSFGLGAAAGGVIGLVIGIVLLIIAARK